MKTLKNLQVRLQSSEAETMFVKSLDVIEKTYVSLFTVAFVLTLANFIITVL